MTKIAPQLKPLAVPIDDLRHDDRNARQHSDRNLDAIKASLQRFGQLKPIVVQKKGKVVRAGNGTLEAARALGWTEIAAVTVTQSDDDAAAFAIADNRTAELAEWDREVLAQLIDDLNPDDIIGFEDREIEKLMASLEDDEPDLDEEEDGDYEDSHVQMVQLFLSTETLPVYMERVAELARVYGTDTPTDTVMEALRRECEAHRSEAAPVAEAV